MKTNAEIYDIVMERKDEFEVHRRARNRRVGAIGSAVLAVAVCVTLGVAAKNGSLKAVTAAGSQNAAGYEGSEIIPSEDIYGEEAEQTAVSKADDDNAAGNPNETEWTGKEMQTTDKIYSGAIVPGESSGFIDKEDIEKGKNTKSQKENTTAPPNDNSGGTYGGDGVGGWCIPAVPAVSGAKPGVRITGEKITDAEAKAYFAENTWIVSALSSSGVPSDNLRFSDKGYCHVSYDGTEGKQLEVRQNFRDYLVYNNGKLVTIVTLTKENGKLSATPAFGGPHFDDFNAFLQKHKGEELLFVYAGWMEIVITPDGECVNPQGYDISKDYGLNDLGVNPYSYFYCDAATYTP